MDNLLFHGKKCISDLLGRDLDSIQMEFKFHPNFNPENRLVFDHHYTLKL